MSLYIRCYENTVFAQLALKLICMTGHLIVSHPSYLDISSFSVSV
jgi:hypothetical protein